jgi:L-amino acid N-acyltransferase YncA
VLSLRPPASLQALPAVAHHPAAALVSMAGFVTFALLAAVRAFDADGQLLGFASWGAFRAFPAYKYTVEHSIYVRADQRGRGLGETLLRELLRLAEQRGLHVLVGGIDMANRGSIALHEKLGFVHTGTLPQVGFKFGRWLDLGFWQKQLATPVQPVDG